jgi:hypothetical protein
MTLADLLLAVKQLPAHDKLRLIRLLAEELDTPSNISPLQPNKVYYLPTPYDITGAGRKLMDAMTDEERSE